MRKDLRIIFMGTPDFAVPSLDILVQHNYNVVAVITAPDKPAGRGLQLQQSPVKKYALEQGIPVLQPEKLKDPMFLEELEFLKPDLQVVVAFRMLPENVWALPTEGTFNLHGSLLPDYRGAAPINWAVINGEKETGVTTFFLKHEIDTGDIIFQEKIEIGKDETAGELHDRMMEVGAGMVLKTVNAIAEGNVKTHPQPATKRPKPAPKIFKESCRIEWHEPLGELHNFVRGLSPYPGAWTMLDGKNFKIYRTHKVDAVHHEPIGNILTDGKKFLKVASEGGFLELLEVQLEGKKKMNIEDFLRGYQVKQENFITRE
jgi:methionyl-tRNA formyltransferase